MHVKKYFKKFGSGQVQFLNYHKIILQTNENGNGRGGRTKILRHIGRLKYFWPSNGIPPPLSKNMHYSTQVLK